MKLPKPRLFSKQSALPPDAPVQPDAGQAVVIVPGVIESMLVLHKGTQRETPFYRDAVKLVKEGPPKGKEHRHPEMYYDSVLNGSRLVAEECAKDVIF